MAYQAHIYDTRAHYRQSASLHYAGRRKRRLFYAIPRGFCHAPYRFLTAEKGCVYPTGRAEVKRRADIEQREVTLKKPDELPGRALA